MPRCRETVNASLDLAHSDGWFAEAEDVSLQVSRFRFEGSPAEPVLPATIGGQGECK